MVVAARAATEVHRLAGAVAGLLDETLVPPALDRPVDGRDSDAWDHGAGGGVELADERGSRRG
jgi:hypothetical protein